MTSFLAGLAVGALTAGATAWQLWLRWAEAHHYRTYKVSAGQWDVLCHDNDHLERLNQRLTAETDT